MKKPVFLLIFMAVIFLSGCKDKGFVKIKGTYFYIESCTAPFIVKFDSDIDAESGDVEYNWDFGDGTTSRDADPVHSYQTTGVYNVKLTVRHKETTDVDDFTIDVSKNPMKPVPGFDFEAVANNFRVPAEIKFYNNSNYSKIFIWNFGDNFGSIDMAPTHIFKKAGTYNVQLKAVCEGDTTKYTNTIVVNPSPTDIIIRKVKIYLPPSFLNVRYKLEIFYNVFNETPYGMPVIRPGSFPMTWDVNQELFYFSGNYNNDKIRFVVWAENDNFAPVYSFETTTFSLQDDYYPTYLKWGDKNDFGAEVFIEYK